MRYWRQARAVRLVALVGTATILALLAPFSSLTATPTPGGATIGLATILALASPVVMGWGISRSDERMEQRSVRPVAFLDLGLVLAFGLGLAAIEMALRGLGIAPAGLIAARATVTYVGLLVVSVPIVGWGQSSMVPVAYLVAVLIGGRGSDVDHPTFWAWIAAVEDDPLSWIVALAMLSIGTIVYLWRGRTA